MPISPSITFSMWATSRNTNGRLKTLNSGTSGPIGPTEMRAICSAPTWACSIISFSPPSCIDGNIWIERRPLVAASSFLPMRLDGGDRRIAGRMHVGGLQDDFGLGEDR